MARWAPDSALRLERAAMDLFTAQGYDATTVPMIAAGAGLTTRTFFRHFADKRDVLFLREREFPEVVAQLLADAPAGLAPLPLAMHGIEAAASGDLQGWRAEIAARRAVIRSAPHLRERELFTSARLAEAIRDALVSGGADALDATLAADVATALFDAALDEWLTGPPDTALVDVVRALRIRLQDLVAR